MGKFLNIVEDLWDELARTQASNKKEPGVTPGAQAAATAILGASQKVAELAWANTEWWEMFRGTYPLSKFGFSTSYRLTEEKYKFLYEREPTLTPEEEEESIWVR